MADVQRFARDVLSRFLLGAHRYRSLASAPGAPAFFTASAVARLGVAMTGLGLLWTVRGLTGSYALAGAATGSFALAEALVGPQAARLVDRHGQTRVLPALVLLHAGAVAAVLTAAAGGSPWVVLAAAAAAGAVVPQPGALSAARWMDLLADRQQLRTAFALEGSVNDVVFLAGPPLVTVLGSMGGPFIGLVAATCCVVLGCIALAAQRRTAPPLHERVRLRHDERRRAGRPFPAVLGVNLGLGCFFGGAPIVVTAFTVQHGFGAAAGPLLALSSAASLLSGLVHGSLGAHRRPERVQLAGTLLLLVATSAGALHLTLGTLAVVLVLAGVTIAPIVITSNELIERGIDRAFLTQGLTWLNTASAAGIAAGGSLAGLTVQHLGPAAALGACGALVAVAPTSALLGSGRFPCPPARSRRTPHTRLPDDAR